MKVYLYLIVLLSLFVSSCAPAVMVSRLAERPSLAADENVTVLSRYEEISAEAELVGSIIIGERGFTTNCSYEAIIATASDQARALGANALKINEHKYPDFVSSCHRISAFAYYMSPENMTPMKAAAKPTADIDDTLPIDIVDGGIDGDERQTEIAENNTPAQTPALTSGSGRYSISDKRANYVPNQHNVEVQRLDNRFRLGFDIGFSYRLGEAVDEESADLLERRGLTYGVEAIYFRRETFGWGLKFSGRSYTKGFFTELGDNKLSVNMNYFGLAFMSRAFDIKHKNAFVSSISGGYIHYVEKVGSNSVSVGYTSGGVGATFALGYDFRIGRSSFFGLQLAVNYGVVPITYYGATMVNNVSSVDLTGGFRF